MENRRRTILISAIIVLFCIAMAVADGVLKTGYFTKSGVKIIVFLALPAVYSVIDKGLRLKPLFRFDKRGAKLALVPAIAVYAVIFGVYILLKDVFDFSGVTKALTKNLGVHGKNFIFVSIYISFVNSLLEEFFFRGFAFLTLKKVATRKFAYLFSAAAFAIYHVAIMVGWFSPVVFVIIMAGLFAGGLIFNYLNEKSGTIYPSWLVHMFANFAINTVGFTLFGIIPEA